MSVHVFGDVTIDNYEYFGKFTELIKSSLKTKNASLPLDMSLRTDHRIVARSTGGAYLLARCLCMGLLPMMYKRGSSYLRSLTEQDGVLSVDLKVGADESAPRLMLFNDGGLRFPAGHDDWLREALRRHGADRCWAVLKVRDPMVKRGEPVRFLDQLQDIRERTVVCLDADDLRASGLTIGRSLSWEKSLHDLVNVIRGEKLLPDRLPQHVVVVFGYDAAVYLELANNSKRDIERGCMIFSRNGSEGEFSARFEGRMPGAQSLFVSVFSGLLYEWLRTYGAAEPNDIPFKYFLGYGLIAKQRMLEAGFIPPEGDHLLEAKEDVQDKAKIWLIPNVWYQDGVLAVPDHVKDWLGEVPATSLASDPQHYTFANPIGRIPKPKAKMEEADRDLATRQLASFEFDSDFLSKPSGDEAGSNKGIFDYLALHLKAKDFIDYVRDEKCSKSVPICTIGKLKTVSNEEIEDLRTIRRLIRVYLENDRAGETPIGICVFGPPGSGKSFAVNSVIETLPEPSKSQTQDAFIECNLSGLEKSDDIAHVFQLARDRRLRGKVPILFFDEFDCSVDSERYYWLKHFLAPLQDGEFTADHVRRPIGKAIFVFAGGVNKTFNTFRDDLLREPDAKNGEKAPMKGRDFLSRLQGHINIGSLEPSEPADEWKRDDKTDERERIDKIVRRFESDAFKPYAMRRAILLRGLLEKRVPSIFMIKDGKKVANIDRDVVAAFLSVPTYEHGVRSMEAIIRMSALENRPQFSAYSLPPMAQLAMHVDAVDFDAMLKSGLGKAAG
jgi:hypothetical protein